MSRSLISMSVLENDEESSVGTGANGRLFNDQRGWPTTPDPSPVPQYPSSTPKLLRDYTHYPSDYYHVCPLVVDCHVYLSLLTHYSYLPMTSRMSLNSVMRVLVPRTLQQGFLT